MLTADCVVGIAVMAFTVFLDLPRHAPYMHLLVTYHFGFIRRAFVGAVVSLFTDAVPLWYVYAIGCSAWVVTGLLYVLAFRKVFGFEAKNFPLFVFMFGSPFFLRNFAVSIGHFDIYGCLWAFVALLMPAGVIYPAIIAAGCVCLILIYHLHFLLYLPTIGFIVFVRYGVAGGFTAGRLVYGFVLAAVLVAVFVATALFGQVPVPPEVFIEYARSRATNPEEAYPVWMWYSTLGQEIQSTWDHFGMNVIRMPVYAVLIGLHYPVARYFASLIAALPTRMLRRATIGALCAVTFGYVVIFIVVYDYSRWVSSWAVCIFLILHATRLLPSTFAHDTAPINPRDKLNLVLGWIVTAIPRVGVTIPF